MAFPAQREREREKRKKVMKIPIHNISVQK
jgi:hypothetical protein